MPGKGRRLLVVEDEPLMAALLCDALRAQNFRVEKALDVLQARQQVRAFDPDAVLIDITLGDGPSGLDLAHVLHLQRPDIALLFLTKHPDLRTAGIRDEDVPPNCGFLRKDMVRDTEYLLESLDAVLSDRPREVRHDMDPAKPLAMLTDKQLDILRLLALGYTNEFIARHKEASTSTVERWVMEIFRAMEIPTRGDLNPRVEAVRRFFAAGGLPDRL